MTDQATNAETADSNWRNLYKVGGAAALLVVLGVVIDSLRAALPGGYTSSETVTEWFSLFQSNWFHGLSGLGFMGMVIAVLNVPVFFALYAVLRRVNRPFAALAAILSFVGTAIYTSSNVALPMLVLSREYAAATTETQQSQIEAAGQALRALGAYSSPGTFMGYLFINGAGIAMGIVMLQSEVFGKLTAWAGILGFGILLLFNVGAAFIPSVPELTFTLLAAPGALLFVAWYALVARRLFQLSRASGQRPARKGAI